MNTPISKADVHRQCGARALIVVRPFWEAAARNPVDAELTASVCSTSARVGAPTHVQVVLISKTGSRCRFKAVIGAGAAARGHGITVGAGGIVNSYEPVESHAEAQEIAEDLRKLLRGTIDVQETTMDGVLYKAGYTFEDAEASPAVFYGRRPRLFGRGVTTRLQFAPWL